MNSESLPVLRTGRKLNVTTDDLENFSAEQRFVRRPTTQKSQRSVSTCGRSSIKSNSNVQQRISSNFSEQKSIAEKSSTTSIQIDSTRNRREIRPSRSILKNSETHRNQSLVDSIELNEIKPRRNRSRSSEKILGPFSNSLMNFSGQIDLVRNEQENQRAISAEFVEFIPLNIEKKSTLNGNSKNNFEINSTVEQEKTRRNSSRLDHFSTEIKPSNFFGSIESNSVLSTGKNSTLENSFQFLEEKFSSRIGNEINSTNFSRFNNDFDHENISRHTPKKTSVSNGNFSLSSTPDGQRNFLNDFQQENLRKFSNNENFSRSPFSELSNEKKRVRFADAEGYSLETIRTNKNYQKTNLDSRRITKKNSAETNQLSPSPRPTFTTFYQALTGVNSNHNRRNKLMTYV